MEHKIVLHWHGETLNGGAVNSATIKSATQGGAASIEQH